MKLRTSWLALILPLSLAWACSSSSDTGNSAEQAGGTGASSNLDGSFADIGLEIGGDGPGSTGTGGTSNTGGTTGTGTAGSLAAMLCGGEGCVCSNGIDDDMDGLIDGFDPECTGPLDNDEASFATGIPGDNRDPKWQDCFFDGNSGAGDDRCRYHTDCLTGDKEPTDKDCSLSAACIEFCGGRTPNGCDCFGCCEVSLGNGETATILTGTDCSLDKLGDATACPVCVQSTECGNTCGTCELCPGKTIADLPPECDMGSGSGGAGSGDGPSYTCDNGEQVCGPGLDECPLTEYCALGCCLRSPPR